MPAMRMLAIGAWACGLAVVGWVGQGYGTGSPLALAMTIAIAAVYLLGTRELWRFHQDNAGLRHALAALHGTPPELGPWLTRLPAGLQQAVRLRIEGERTPLPGPAMAPYLVGLLVLLGMLGTFLGMVVTLQGAVLALESTTDIATIRAALAAPVKGLGLAFGTSVAGVAASTMLGLVSALARRERLGLAQALDTAVATSLRGYSRAQQRDALLQAVQGQAAQMPQLLGQLQALMAQMATQTQTLNDQLLAGQDRFHASAQAAYSGLAQSVDQTLRHSLQASAEAAAQTIEPLVARSLAQLTKDGAVYQAQMAAQVERQLDGLAERVDRGLTQAATAWDSALQRQQLSHETLAGGLQQALAQGQTQMQAQSTALLASLAQAQAAQQAATAAHEQQRLSAWTGKLEHLQLSLQQAWQQHSDAAQAQQAQIVSTLARTAAEMQAQADAQATRTLAEMQRLIETASEAPRAAALVVAELRQRLSDSLVQDQALLGERAQVLATLGHLMTSLSQAAGEQRAAIDALVAATGTVLRQTAEQATARIETEAQRLAEAAAQVSGGAVDMASLGEAFGVAVQLFSGSSTALTQQLQRIEAALSQSSARSDQQLAYYVAQARELIDLSISSQQQIVDDLRQWAPGRAASASATATAPLA
jgi:hypothetical protein